MKWQCPKCKRVYGHYYTRVNVDCAGCGLNVASFQPFEDHAADASHIEAGAPTADRPGGRTSEIDLDAGHTRAA